MVRKHKNTPSTTAGSDSGEKNNEKLPTTPSITKENPHELRELKKVKFSEPAAPASPPRAKGHKQRGHMKHPHKRRSTKLEDQLIGIGVSQLGISEDEQAGFIRVSQQGKLEDLRAASGGGMFSELAAEIGGFQEDSEWDSEWEEDAFESEEEKAMFEAWLLESGQGDLCSSVPLSKKDGRDDEDEGDMGGGDAIGGVTGGVRDLTLFATSAV